MLQPIAPAPMMTTSAGFESMPLLCPPGRLFGASVRYSARRNRRSDCCCELDMQVAMLVEPGGVTRSYERCRIELLDDSRTGEAQAGAQQVPSVYRGLDRCLTSPPVDRPLACDRRRRVASAGCVAAQF